MRTKSRLATVGAALAVGAGAVAAWTVAEALATRDVERVPFEVLGHADGVEFRRYPETVRAVTTAPSETAAFRRLFEYITGANAEAASVEMTAPVETVGGEASIDRAGVREGGASGVRASEGGASVAMTAPVETTRNEAGLTMSFFLPAEYTAETAPEPTDGRIDLVVDPPRTLAVRSFSWWTPAWRVARERRYLLETLDLAGVAAIDDPVLLRYDPPFTPPFRRTNEVVVEVDPESLRRAADR